MNVNKSGNAGANGARGWLGRFCVLVVTALLLLIPLFMVEHLIDGRENLYGSVVRDITRSSGGEQQISGPLLLLPCTRQIVRERRVVPETPPQRRRSRAQPQEQVISEISREADTLVILPSSVSFNCSILPETRRRGIYKAMVYEAAVSMRGSFEIPERAQLERVVPGLESIDYENAALVTGVTSMTAIRGVGAIRVQGRECEPKPGTRPLGSLGNGFKTPCALDPAQSSVAFSQEFSISGSAGIRFTPSGQNTRVHMVSSWPHPSFQGQILPITHTIGENGFSADWNIPSLTRPYPTVCRISQWQGPEFSRLTVGADLFQTATHYGLVQRAIQYGSLFIFLTFMALCVFELGMGIRLHPFQYGATGLAIVLFYLTLLALSEHAPFLPSYAAASAIVIIMETAYMSAVMKSLLRGLGVGVFFFALYTLLYTILQMEKYALLTGTALLLIMLGVFMYVSRNLSAFAQAREQGLPPDRG